MLPQSPPVLECSIIKESKTQPAINTQSPLQNLAPYHVRKETTQSEINRARYSGTAEITWPVEQVTASARRKSQDEAGNSLRSKSHADDQGALGVRYQEGSPWDASVSYDTLRNPTENKNNRQIIGTDTAIDSGRFPPSKRSWKTALPDGEAAYIIKVVLTTAEPASLWQLPIAAAAGLIIKVPRPRREVDRRGVGSKSAWCQITVVNRTIGYLLKKRENYCDNCLVTLVHTDTAPPLAD